MTAVVATEHESFGHARCAVVWPVANHYVFLFNEADVLREMRAFVSRLR